MKNEYIIINRTALKKRIEELGKISKEFYYREGTNEFDFAKDELEEILSQSTPLIPEIEKAFDAGVLTLGHYVDKEKQNYILNLKLDI